MWPWEHLAVGYLIYSLGARVLGRGPPTFGTVAVLAVASQLPDLIDKPLSWGLGWFPSGYAVGHSVFVAVPVGLFVLLVGRRLVHPRWGVAFIVGYWSHLLADVANPLRYGEGILPARVLWPIVEAPTYEFDYGIGRGLVYFEGLLAALVTLPPTDVFLRYILLPVATIAIWYLDGAPGMALARRALDQLRCRLG